MRALILRADAKTPKEVEPMLAEVEPGRRVFVVPTGVDLDRVIEQMPKGCLRKEMEDAERVDSFLREAI